MLRRLAAVALLLGLAPTGRFAAADAPAPPPRAVLPIHAVTLSDGAVRYGVPIRIGDTILDAALDTGSTGLRILPGALSPSDAAPSGEPESYGYASGSRYEGVAGEARLALGDIAGSAPVHLIASIGCFAQLPHCPASRTPLAHYGIASDGLPDEGFKAILGLNTDRARVGNPLMAIGVRRWIVEAPRPGHPDEGRLILNPTPAETKDYLMLPLAGPYAQIHGGGLHDALPGCLASDVAKARICGPLLMDTGTSFLAVANARRGAPWPDGSPAQIEFLGLNGATAVKTTVTLGSRDEATRLVWRDEPRAPGTVILAGVAPYFAFSVLYDARRQEIGLKPRVPTSATGEGG